MNDNKSPSVQAQCSMCSALQVDAYKPFCSKRCADLDLHRWLNGSYAIPAVEGEEDGLSATMQSEE